MRARAADTLILRYGLSGSINFGILIYTTVPLSHSQVYRVPGALGIGYILSRSGRNA